MYSTKPANYMVVDLLVRWLAVGQVVVDLLVQLVTGFWMMGRWLWIVICVLSVSFLVGMLGCEDVCEIFSEFDLPLGLDCKGGHSGERVGLWWGEGLVERADPVFKCKMQNNNKIINENIFYKSHVKQKPNKFFVLKTIKYYFYKQFFKTSKYKFGKQNTKNTNQPYP